MSESLIGVPYRPEPKLCNEFVRLVRDVADDRGLQRDLPEVLSEFAYVVTALAGAAQSLERGEPRYAIFEQTTQTERPRRRALGIISLSHTFQYGKDMEPGIRAAGVEPEALGASICYWARRHELAWPHAVQDMARMAVQLGRAYSDPGKPPWIILNQAPDDPSREYREVGMRRVGDYHTGWLASDGLDDQPYALFVAGEERAGA